MDALLWFEFIYLGLAVGTGIMAGIVVGIIETWNDD